VSERVSTVVPSATGCASNGRLAVGVAVGVAGGWVGVELIAAWVTNEAIVRRLSKSFWGFGCHGKDVLKMFEKIGIERRSKSGAWGNISLEMTFASKIELFDIERHLLWWSLLDFWWNVMRLSAYLTDMMIASTVAVREWCERLKILSAWDGVEVVKSFLHPSNFGVSTLGSSPFGFFNQRIPQTIRRIEKAT
jgi:hypothetical protein